VSIVSPTNAWVLELISASNLSVSTAATCDPPIDLPVSQTCDQAQQTDREGQSGSGGESLPKFAHDDYGAFDLQRPKAARHVEGL
jgi:hypothetical protein